MANPAKNRARAVDMVRNVAIHEAGHAVIMARAAMKITSISINRKAIQTGRGCQGMTTAQPTQAPNAGVDADIAVAGAVAESIVRGISAMTIISKLTDKMDIVETLTYAGVPKGQHNAAIQMTIDAVTVEITANWSMVEQIADVLMANETITGEQIAHIVG